MIKLILFIILLSTSILNTSNSNSLDNLTINDVNEAFKSTGKSLVGVDADINDPFVFTLHKDKTKVYQSELGKIYILEFNNTDEREGFIVEKKIQMAKVVGIAFKNYKIYETRNFIILLITDKDENNLDDVLRLLKQK